jgi:hypothetical protein
MKPTKAAILAIILAFALPFIGACSKEGEAPALVEGTLPEVTVNGRVITPGDVEAAYNLTNHLRTENLPDRLQVLHTFVTQQVIAAMFEAYGMEIPPAEIEKIENAYSEFKTIYDAAIESGEESEIAYLEEFKAVQDAAREASGLSEAEFEAYNIEQTKILIMRYTLLNEKFGGDAATMKLALEEFADSGKVEIVGEGYTFSAVINDSLRFGTN